MLKAGQAAPMFVLPDADMELIDIAQFQGKSNVILFFYPRDDTPCCTLQATDFSDHEDQFARHDCTIIGISVMTASGTPNSETNTEFRSLSFPIAKGSRASATVSGRRKK